MQLIQIDGLNPLEYEHPFDKQALDALQGTTGLETLVQKFYEWGITDIIRLNFTGNSLRVTPTSFPELHGLLLETCQILNLPFTPELYVQRMADLEGATLGAKAPFVVLSTEAVEKFTELELRFLLGKHIGHIKSQHVLYLEIGHILPSLGELVGDLTMGFGNLLSAGLRWALVYWQRMAGYTGDRAGLLACQNIEAAASVLAKISGLPTTHFDRFEIDDFAAQARDFKHFDQTNYKKALKFLFGSGSWSMARANEFFKWTDAGGYQLVLERKSAVAPKRFCGGCGREIKPPTAGFCGGCGKPTGG